MNKEVLDELIELNKSDKNPYEYKYINVFTYNGKICALVKPDKEEEIAG